MAELLDDDAEKFLFAGAEKKFAWLCEVHFCLNVRHALAIYFHAALFQQTVGFAS